MTDKALPRFITSVIVPGFFLGAATIPAWAQTTSPTSSPTTVPTSLTLRDRAEELWQEHQVSIILIGALLGGYLGVLWIRPIWLLRVPSQDIAVPWTAWEAPLNMVRWFKYRDRVLDAWVKQHWQIAQQEFFKLPTVDSRAIHIPLPVKWDKHKVSELTGVHLIPTFQKKTAILLICGEGGAGKTSLACQVAQWGLEKQLSAHRMIPVLIETELDGEKENLLAAIQGRLNALTDQSDPIEPEFVRKLLRRQRVLVIVDHLSEMGETTRRQINPQLADFPAKALVVTSRLEELLGSMPKTVVKPLQVEANHLWPFMCAYLEAKGKQDLFVDDEYADGSDRLRHMAGERSITVLLARMYIDQMIREREGAGDVRPDSVPKLMLSYLNQLNRSIEPKNYRDDLEVQLDAKIIAWECLKQSYRPVWIRKVDAIAALDKLEDKVPGRERLNYLEKRLQFLQSPEPGDSIRVILDPLAEYLAAAHLVEQVCQQPDPEATWQRFLTDINYKLEKENETPEIIRGFLLAVRDCCLDNMVEDSIPKELPDKLARKANIDPDELRRMQEIRRIRRLMSELSAPELKYRLSAAEDLANRGAAARVAEPNLVGMLENPNQPLQARQAAAQTLGKLSIGAASLLAITQDADQDPILRSSTAEALGKMKTGKANLLDILENHDQPLRLRQGAARAIGLMGVPCGEPVPMLIPQFQNNEVVAQVKTIRVWKENLPHNLTLELVAIPRGEFLMGSSPDESGREVYESQPETQGLDFELLHRVVCPTFWISRYPVTQAQWLAIANLPKVGRDLNAYPANFKGNRRPVEAISWHEAIEFCNRLSQMTGKIYRLPSEAEWEYACRAGTTTPFHFGESISTDFANYDGNYTYGCGTKGVCRRETTDVDYFGVANDFGLSDMHGNVWEWCLDTWHPTFKDAPIDGSAWLLDGDSSFRILRGGSWYNGPGYHCRSAARGRNSPDLRSNSVGFRVVCSSLGEGSL